MHAMITSLLEKYRLLMIEESKTWNNKDVITKAEEDAHKKQKNVVFVGKISTLEWQ